MIYLRFKSIDGHLRLKDQAGYSLLTTGSVILAELRADIATQEGETTIL